MKKICMTFCIFLFLLMLPSNINVFSKAPSDVDFGTDTVTNITNSLSFGGLDFVTDGSTDEANKLSIIDYSIASEGGSGDALHFTDSVITCDGQGTHDPRMLQFSSIDLNDNFRLNSLYVLGTMLTSGGSRKIDIKGYDGGAGGTLKASVTGIDLAIETIYGIGDDADITYDQTINNAADPNPATEMGGLLTFGSGWTGIDTVVITDFNNDENLEIALDSLKFSESDVAISSVVASNTGSNLGLGNGDTVTITFNMNTNRPAIAAADLGSKLKLSGGHSWGTLQDGDIAWNGSGNILTITLSNVTGSTIATGDTITVDSSANIRDSGLTYPNCISSGSLTGTFTSAPAITSIVASNTGYNRGLGINDKVVITFDQNTNMPPITAASINSKLKLDNGHSWGSLQNTDIVWNGAGNVLTVTFSSIAGASIAVGDTITLDTTAGIKDSAATTAESTESGSLTGTFTSPVEISSIDASNDGANIGLGVGDKVAITFDQKTNKPSITAATINDWLKLNNGHSWGSGLVDGDIVWNANGDILTITFSSITGSTIAVGDTITLDALANLKDSGSTVAASTDIGALTGTFTSIVDITGIVAYNSGANPGLATGDKVEITFDQNTNKPTITAANIDSKLKLNNGHSWGTGLQNGDIAWNVAGNILTITFSSVTGSTIAVGDTITLDITADISDAGLTVTASTAADPVTGTFTSSPAITGMVAANSGANLGLGVGDSVAITFDQNTNKPPITAATINSMLKPNNGHSWGTALLDADIEWNAAGNILTITLSNITNSTIAVGDTITLDVSANIKDAGATVAESTDNEALTGTFSPLVGISSMVASNSGTNLGLGAGDTVVITFDQNTNKPSITAATINSMLKPNNGHSWGTGLLDGSIEWNIAGNMLTITFNSITNTTIAVGDTITLDATADIRDAGLTVEASTSGGTISGTFTSPPGITSISASNTGGNIGLGIGDTIVITFDQNTNKPTITAATINSKLKLDNGHSWGTNLNDGDIVWNVAGNILTVTLSSITNSTIAIGDTITLDTTAGIKDSAATTTESTESGSLTGTFTSPVEISSIVASNAGANIGRGIGDKVVITFDQNTNKPSITAATINDKLKLNNGHSWGSGLVDGDIVWNANGDILTITFSSITGSTIAVGDTITLDALANLKDSGSTVAASTDIGTLTGTFTSIVDITGIVAYNSGANPGLATGDKVEITFDQNTNKPTITAANIDSKLKLNNGHSWGTGLQNGDIAWNVAGNILTITFSSVTGSTIAVGDTITLDITAGIRDAGLTVTASTAADPVTGTFTSSPAITGMVAANSGANLGLGVGDSVIITFDQNTNKPSITAANINSMLGLNNGHNWGTALLDADIAWNAAGNILTITLSNITNSTIAVGDTITLDASANIKDSGATVAASTDSEALTGTFSFLVGISSMVASNSGTNLGLGAGDTVVITFDQNTNKPVITAATIDGKLKLNNGHSWGTGLLDSSIAWNGAGNILTITFNSITNSTITVGDTITLDTTANIRDAGLTVEASTSSGTISGTFTSPPAVTSILASNTGGNIGLGIGDTVVITFDQNTNKPAITAATINSKLKLNNGHSWGTNLSDGDISWNVAGNILTVTFSSTTNSTIAIGDTITLDTTAGIKDSAATTEASIESGSLTGTFTSPVEISSVAASNAGANIGRGIGDKVVITFDQNTNKPSITAVNINSKLKLNNGHSWGTALQDADIVWNGTGNTLTITFSSITGSTIAVGDTITLDASAGIKDSGETTATSTDNGSLTGTFTSAPSITSIIALNTGSNAGLGIGDKVAVSFDQSTNKPSITAADINSKLALGNGHSWGSLQNSDIAWNTEGNVLFITFSSVTGSTITVGDTITLDTSANIKDANATTAASASSGSLTGTFTSVVRISSIAASNTGGSPGLDTGDTVAITFDQNTNKPSITAVDIDNMLSLNNGHSWGSALQNADMEWNAAGNILTITFSSVTGSTISIGDVITLNVAANIKDAGSTVAASTYDGTIAGTFTSAVSISSISASNSGSNLGLGVNDTVVITFDQNTNKPTISGAGINSMLKLNNGHSWGSGLQNSNIVWNAAGNILTITFSNVTGATIAVGDTITLDSTANIKDSGLTAPASTASGSITGTFTSAPAISIIKAYNSNTDAGLGVGDRIEITFDQNTNKPVITAASIDSKLKLNNGHSWGTNLDDADISWNVAGNKLTITFSDITASTIAAGDTITLDAVASIKDSGLTTSASTASGEITGSFALVISTAPNSGNITVVNNKSGTSDTVTVTSIQAGDVIKVYNSAFAGVLLGTATVANGQTSGVVSIALLNPAGGDVYVTITGDGMGESDRTQKSYTAEPTSTPSKSSTQSTATPTPTPTSDKSNGPVNVNNNVNVDSTVKTEVVEGKKVTTITIEPRLEDVIKQEHENSTVTIDLTRSENKTDVVVGQLTGQTVKEMENKDAVLEIKTENVSYTLPASQINIDSVSDKIGKDVKLKDIVVDVKIAPPSQEKTKEIEEIANKKDYKVVVKPVEFNITCNNGGKTVEVSKFNGYVERMVAVPDGVDPSKITTGIVLNTDGTFSHVPTSITQINGRYYAKINSLTNSIYSVIWSPRTFKDVEKHWAKDSVNDMGSRLVIDGIGGDNFAPDLNITRAEFASIVVKALGLMRPKTGKDTYTDVPKAAWYYDAVSIASEYGIINGYGNGKFGPADKITREQAAAMITRAAKITGLKPELKEGEAASQLSAFKDIKGLPSWSMESLAVCVKTGIISGKNSVTLAPKDLITRAEVAAVVRRLLQKSNLINVE